MPTGVSEIQKLLLNNIKQVLSDELPIEKAKVICQQVQSLINVTRLGIELEQRDVEFNIPIELTADRKLISEQESEPEVEEIIDAKPTEKVRILQPGVTGDELVGRKQVDPRNLDHKTGRPKGATDPFN